MAFMIDWDDMRVCLSVQRARTWAQAGELLGLNPTTVSRRLSGLEERLGTRLFDRTPDGCVPTAVGLRLLERAERMEREMQAVSRELENDDRKADGRVRIATTEMIATRFIAPLLGRLSARHAGIELELLCGSELLDLSRREADIALRLTRPDQAELVIKRLASVDLALYASHDYVAARGLPGEEGAGHDVLPFAHVRAFARENAWLERSLPAARVAFRSNSVSTVYAACMGGAGIALLPRIVADRATRLCRVRDTGPEPRSIWQAVHAGIAQSARIRAVSAFLVEVFTPQGEHGG